MEIQADWDDMIDHIVNFGEAEPNVPLLVRTPHVTRGPLRLNVPVVPRKRWRINRITVFTTYEHVMQPIAYRSDAVQIYPSTSREKPFAVWNRRAGQMLKTEHGFDWNFLYLSEAMKIADEAISWSGREPLPATYVDPSVSES